MRRFLALMLTGTIGFLLVPAGYAHADVTDGPAAALSNTLDQANDALGWVGTDITCKPEADGGPVTQETNFIVGKIFAQDLGVGRGTCHSLNVPSYTMEVFVKIQYYDNGWKDTGCNSPTVTTRATQGVAVAVPPARIICNYGDLSPYLDSYHRARTVLTNTVDTRIRRATSAIWFMRRG
ncbi:MAG: hypothetical protein ACRDLB_02265 [Actinomycetota bacterium]